MTGSKHIDARVPDTTGWWQDDYEDMFAAAADTTRQARPVVAEPTPRDPREPPPLPALAPDLAAPSAGRAPDLAAPSAGRAPDLRALSPVGATVRIVIADADQVLQQILGYQLTRLGWEVSCICDGHEVARLLADGRRIDVLLVDLNLPHRNAYELLEALRPQRGETGQPRVIVMSEQMQDDKVVRALALGADDFVAKPINPRVVASRIQRLLGRVP